MTDAERLERALERTGAALEATMHERDALRARAQALEEALRDRVGRCGCQGYPDTDPCSQCRRDTALLAQRETP